MAKEFECSAGFDSELRAWVQSASKELDVRRKRPLTTAILNGDLMNAVGMENQHT